MAGLLIEARDAASTARQAGQSALDAVVLEDLVARYRALAAAGLAANLYRRTATAKDARRIARRFLGFEDLILRFATRPDLDIFSNNEAERTIRPVKVQQRSSGGAGGPSTGSPDFATRPVLPVHRRQMGHQHTRRPPRPVQRPRLATAWHRTIWITQSSAGPPQGFRSPARLGIIYPWTATGTVSSPGASRPWATWSKDDPDPSRRSGHTPMTW